MKESRAVRRAVGLTGGVMAAWWAGVTWGIPLLIRAAHAGRLPLVGRLLPGRATRPVAGYLELWEPIARASVVMAWTAAVLLLGAYLLRRHARSPAAATDATGHLPVTAGPFLLVAAWLGLVTGLGEAWYYLSRVFYQGKESAGVSGISQHAVWLSPLANLVMFALAGGLVALALRLAGRRLVPRAAITGLIGLAALTLIMVTGRLHWVAAAVLALGVAAQVSRNLSAGGGEVVALARRSTPWLLALVIGMGLLVPIAESRRERRQLAAAGTPAPDAPNVLFVVLDTERAASTSLHGAVRPTTPFLEELAREGVQFERAIAPTSWTLPSHAAMFTGREVRDLGVDWNSPLDDRYPVLAEVLSEHGYATAGFVANHKFLADLFGLGRGFGVWRDQPIQPGTIISHSWLAHLIVGKSRKFLGNHQMLSRKTADMVNSEFLDWLAIRPDRPFFAFLNYFDAHAPYLPPEPWNLRFAPTQPRYWIEGSSPGDYPPSDLDELRIAYATGIAYLDDRLKALFEALGRRGLLENTLIVITSDHGEDFGEGTQVGHGNDLTMPLVHVPLVIIEPGTVPAGVNVAVPVQLQDLAATILDLTVGEDPAIEGESLASHWRIPVDSLPLHVLYSNDGLVTSVVTDSFQLLHARDGSDRLFNHREDPLGLHDLALDPAHAGTLAEHQRLLQAHLDAQP